MERRGGRAWCAAAPVYARKPKHLSRCASVPDVEPHADRQELRIPVFLQCKSDPALLHQLVALEMIALVPGLQPGARINGHEPAAELVRQIPGEPSDVSQDAFAQPASLKSNVYSQLRELGRPYGFVPDVNSSFTIRQGKAVHQHSGVRREDAADEIAVGGADVLLLIVPRVIIEVGVLFGMPAVDPSAGGPSSVRMTISSAACAASDMGSSSAKPCSGKKNAGQVVMTRPAARDASRITASSPRVLLRVRVACVVPASLERAP